MYSGRALVAVSFSFARSLPSNQVVSDVHIVQQRGWRRENKGIALMSGDPGSTGGQNPCRRALLPRQPLPLWLEVAGPGYSSLRGSWKLTVASVAAAFYLPAP